MKLFRHCAGALAIALALGSTGCSSDEPINKGNGVAEQDETRYILITLSSPSDGSRAFEDGTTNESAVTRLDFLFYDNEGNQIGEPQTFTGSDLKDDDFANDKRPNVTRIWTSVVPVQVEQGKALPAQVICLVNAEASRATALKGKSLTDLLDIQDGTFYNGQNFVMTNSVYYGTSPYAAGTTRICATPVNTAQLFSTQQAAKDALDAATATGATADQKALMVDIYVERSAAKVGLTLSSGNVNTYTLANGDGTGDVTLTFVPQYWFMNAIDKTMYSTKRYGIPNVGAAVDMNMDPTFEQINTNFQGSGMANGAWNDPDNSRSYWGCSPSYAKNVFPLVSDNVWDLSVPKDNNYNKSYNQNYYSFNDVKGFASAENTGIQAKAIAYNNGFSITNTGAAATGYIYTTETTTAKTSINDVANGNPAAAVASAVIVGHYYKDNAPESGEYPTFWIDINDGENGTYYGIETNAKKALIARNAFIFSDDKGHTPLETPDAFALMHPEKAVRLILTDKDNIAGRYVTLQLGSVPESAYYWDGRQYAKITASNLAQANAALAGVGYLDMYNNGRAFFNIPVRHLGWPTNDELADGTKLYENGTYNWAKMRVGDLGIVRNHVYKLNITKISGLGSGLRSDDQPIVPPVHAYKQFIAMRLNILAWNIVPAQNIEL